MRIGNLSRGSLGRIYLVPVDGSEPVALTDACLMPNWSFDRLTFACVDGNNGILIFKTNGTATRTKQMYAITTNLHTVDSVSLAPDDKHLLYVALSLNASNDWFWGVYTNTIDGENQKLLAAEAPASNGIVPDPAHFSPNGRTILFQHIVGGAEQVWTMDADGSDQKALLGFHSGSSIFSADGSEIYFSIPGSGIYSANADGSNQKLVLGGIIGTCAPSATGEQIAYWSNGSIGIANVDGSNQHILKNDNITFNGFPTW